MPWWLQPLAHDLKVLACTGSQHRHGSAADLGLYTPPAVTAAASPHVLVLWLLSWQTCPYRLTIHPTHPQFPLAGLPRQHGAGGDDDQRRDARRVQRRPCGGLPAQVGATLRLVVDPPCYPSCNSLFGCCGPRTPACLVATCFGLAYWPPDATGPAMQGWPTPTWVCEWLAETIEIL